MTPVYVPVMQIMVIAGAIFALLAIGASITYRLATFDGTNRHTEALLLGAQLYAAVAAVFVGAGVLIAGLPASGLIEGLTL
jgi:hypothetical protein